MYIMYIGSPRLSKQQREQIIISPKQSEELMQPCEVLRADPRRSEPDESSLRETERQSSRSGRRVHHDRRQVIHIVIGVESAQRANDSRGEEWLQGQLDDQGQEALLLGHRHARRRSRVRFSLPNLLRELAVSPELRSLQD
uniref:Uncharacterized protein n=1 Tax=Trichogramma kaykai TaxID=54128 RepID=A0ABD2XAY8_9HYME